MERCATVSTPIWFWIAFHIGVFIALGVDLVSFKRRGRELSMRAAALRSAAWVGVSLLFNVIVWQWQGHERGLDFLTGYLIEYSLSVDNIFVFVLIFTYFRVPSRSQHRVLVWGILGALVMRGVMIWLGIALVQRFHFILYIFGLFLVVTAVRMFWGKAEELDFTNSCWMRWCRNSLPLTKEFHGRRFAGKIDARLVFTHVGTGGIVFEVIGTVLAG